ncbi:MAG: hypothetical protein NXI27_11210 [Alphaproteobacteria bacterium]|nr:hypothetical protein [Alphaproteobacteria bacterium]
MTPEQATCRYFKAFVPAICVYAVGTVGITWLGSRSLVPSAVLYMLALVPVVAIFLAFWAHWRFATEVDEFLRLIQIKGTLFGIACVMIVASGWGTLETLADAPNLPVFWLLPIFWVAQSAATAIISKREGVF